MCMRLYVFVCGEEGEKKKEGEGEIDCRGSAALLGFHHVYFLFTKAVGETMSTRCALFDQDETRPLTLSAGLAGGAGGFEGRRPCL